MFMWEFYIFFEYHIIISVYAMKYQYNDFYLDSSDYLLKWEITKKSIN